MARDMMLTPDEYMAIKRLIDSERESEGASLANRDDNKKKSKKKGSNKYSRALSRALEEQNKLQKKVSKNKKQIMTLIKVQ